MALTGGLHVQYGRHGEKKRATQRPIDPADQNSTVCIDVFAELVFKNGWTGGALILLWCEDGSTKMSFCFDALWLLRSSVDLWMRQSWL